MPTSYHGYITDVISEVRRLHPATILDIGIGFGKWGFLFREYLDVMNGRVFKDQWTTQIEGIEIFHKYIMPHQQFIYNHIYNMNVLDFDYGQDYDLIFMSDVLEHIAKPEAMALLRKIKDNCKMFYLILPMGEKWLNSQGGMYGNINEAHISQWNEEDIPLFKAKKTYVCNEKPINFYIL
jgi:SAM-dependent methyltransferase